MALAAIYDGASRTEAAKIGGVTLQIVRDWVVKFNTRGPDGLIDRKAPGQASKLNETHRQALVKMIDDGPIPAIHGVVRWRLVDLCQWMLHTANIILKARQLGFTTLCCLIYLDACLFTPNTRAGVIAHASTMPKSYSGTRSNTPTTSSMRG